MDTTKIITATELKENLGMYLDYVTQGNEAVVTKNGKKAVRLTPYVNEIEQYFTMKERALDYQHGGKKVSYEEFMDIYQKTELRMEFINGEIVILDSPEVYHQDIAGNLYMILRRFLKGSQGKVYFAPFDVHFFKQDLSVPDVMQPDLLIAFDAGETVNERGRYMGTPALCVEIISKSTRPRDLLDKLNTYMLSGVHEYWIVDPYHKNVLVYSFNDYTIEEMTTYKLGDMLTSFWFKGLQVSTEEIFAH
jgi:prevent-host-death family protein